MNKWIDFGKDEDPTNTVEKIEKILEESGIKLKEVLSMCGEDNCYSSRMVIDGELSSFFGTNGKGSSKMLCKASCMGEMVERLSNKMFLPFLKLYVEKHLFYEDKYPMYDLLDDKQEVVIKNIIDKYIATIDFPIYLQTKEMYVISTLYALVNGENKKYFYTVPFYSITDKKIIYLPEGIIRQATSSTGMAAGNTLEEASVQAISEILERYVYYKLLTEDIVLPRIPDEIIEKYPKVSAVIANIKKNTNYDVYIYDASLGKSLPVVCLVIVDKMTGTFGIKLGAHPNIGIALNRVFTEAMQGISIDGFVKLSQYTFENKNSIVNVYNHFKCGVGYVKTNILKNDPTYSFNEWKDVSGLSNKELLKYMLNILKNNNSKVYIRDVSYMGFPSVYIYASEFSDVLIDIKLLKQKSAINSAIKVFKHIDNITIDELKKIKNAILIKKSNVGEKVVKILCDYCFSDDVFGAPFEDDVLLMIVEYMLGDIESAIKMLNNILKIMEGYVEDDKKEYFYILLKYFESIYHNVDKEKSKEIMYNTFDKELVDKVYGDFGEKEKILAKLYPVCKNDCVNCVNKNCKNKAIDDLFDKLMDKEEKNLSDYTKLASLIE